MATDGMITSGPIVACQNAIDHYVNALEAQVNRTNNLRRQLSESLDTESMLDGMLTQWREAKELLERTRRESEGWH